MTNRTLIQGTIEYLDVEVVADANLTGVVEFSFDDTATWEAAAWIGSVGTTRTARLLVDTTELDGLELVWARGNYEVWVRLTDAPEVAIVQASSGLSVVVP